MKRSGLDAIGTAGQAYLREALTSTTDPLKAIEEFQRDNGIKFPSLAQMLPMLDLHGVRRFDFHMSLLEELREKLITRINEIGQQDTPEKESKLKQLLDASFPAVKIKHLRPVVMAILKHTNEIDEAYLKVLVRDADLYKDADTEVKRQIWKDNQSLFGDEVSPLLTQYIREKESVLFDHQNLTNLFFAPSPKVRRQGEVVQKLAHMIGSNVKLYDMVLQFLRTLFLRTHNVHYCSLRAELLMSLHDLEIQDIIAVDPCHKFAWCLDACIREKNVDIKRSRELQTFLDGVQQGQEQVLGDLSMILCDPYAVNFLCISAIKILNYLINNDGLPRENSILVLILRMLALGSSTWDILNSQDFREPTLDCDIVIKFLPALMSLMVDDQVRSINNKLPPDERESAITIIEHSGPIPETIQTYIQESSVASVIAMYYTLSTAKTKDRVGMMRILGSLASCAQDRAYEDPFLHSLVSYFIQQPEEFTAEDFCTVVFDEFFYPGLARENVIRHVLKLVWYVYPRLPSSRLTTLLKVVEPNYQHGGAIHSLYETLKEKITSEHEPDSTTYSPNPDYLESPLMSVPTPAAL